MLAPSGCSRPRPLLCIRKAQPRIAGPALPPRPSRARQTVVRAGQGSILTTLEVRLTQFVTELAGYQLARKVQQLLLSMVSWFMATLLQLQRLRQEREQQRQQKQQQLQLTSTGTPDSSQGDGYPAFTTSGAAAAAVAAGTQQQAGAVIDFLSAATLGAVEQLRCTLTDASQGIESKMSALERTASSVQDTLFQAARAHSEAVRSNPAGGMWKQPCVESVLSEEERLRSMVFAQVYAELMQRDAKDLSYRDTQP